MCNDTTTHTYKLTCFACVTFVTVNTDTRVSVHIVGTIPAILTGAADTLVHVYNINSNCGIFFNCVTSYSGYLTW